MLFMVIGCKQLLIFVITESAIGRTAGFLFDFGNCFAKWQCLEDPRSIYNVFKILNTRKYKQLPNKTAKIIKNKNWYFEVPSLLEFCNFINFKYNFFSVIFDYTNISFARARSLPLLTLFT